MTYWYSVAGRNLALRKTKKVDNYIKSKSNALRANDVRVPVNGPVSELDLFGSCSGASPQLQVGVVDKTYDRTVFNEDWTVSGDVFIRLRQENPLLQGGDELMFITLFLKKYFVIL